MFGKLHVHVSATEQSVKALRAEALMPLCKWRVGKRQLPSREVIALSDQQWRQTLGVGSSMGDCILHRKAE
jgi:hypothetical protein